MFSCDVNTTKTLTLCFPIGNCDKFPFATSCLAFITNDFTDLEDQQHVIKEVKSQFLKIDIRNKNKIKQTYKNKGHTFNQKQNQEIHALVIRYNEFL